MMGLVGAILTIIMFSSMIEIAVNNHKGITTIWFQPVMTIVSTVVWFAYGLFRKDMFLMIANGAGFLFAVITLWAIFI